VHAHGGTVRVESREGQGSTFTVTVKAGCGHLPLDRLGVQRNQLSTATNAAAYVEEAVHWVSEMPPVSSPASLPIEESTEPSRVSRSRILLVDDNADMRGYVCRLLDQRFDITAVPDGTTALATALASPPDLVLSDVMMPGLDGFGLLRELRADKRTRTVPVILLSARAGEESSIEGLDAGADDYLVKPFSARELLARVRTHLELAKLRREYAVELEAANKELDAFSYSISHDLRAPLRAINGFSQILVKEFSAQMPPEAQRLLNTVTASAQRMGQLIEDLLRFSRLGRQSLSKRPVKISDLVHKVLEKLSKEQGDRNIEVRVSDLPDCVGDPSLLEQVFVNLLSNAFKYTGQKEKAIIEVNCRQQEREKVYFVRDNGAGFDMRYAEKLFGVFQRLHSADEFEGTGVGLSIVHRIVKRHGGRIWAEAEVDKGATFYFSLPG